MKKVIFAICEGAHDIAFLYRLFLADGFYKFKKKISEFPYPISSYIIESLKNADTDLEKLKIEETRQKNLPQEILFKDETLVLFYGIGGVDRKGIRSNMLKHIDSFSIAREDTEAIDRGGALQYVFIYFFDSDHIGVTARVQSIKEELRDAIGGEVPGLVSGGGLQSIKGLQVGCYIFANENGYGKLEDILIPMMQEGNEEIFQKAADFLKLKEEGRLTKLEIVKRTDGELEEKYSTKKLDFDEKKSQIGIAGQLQVSGKSNAVIIKDTDYIKLQKIRDNHLCRNILNFIHSL